MKVDPETRRLFKTLPLGTRFKYVDGTDTWVVLERHGCGLVAKWDGKDGWVAGQAICSFAGTEEECETEEVIAIDWTDGNIEMSSAGKEALDKFVGEPGGREPDTLEKAKRRSEYWKAEHAAANVEIERLRTVAEAANRIQYGHNTGNGGMIVSGEHMRILWKALDALETGETE